MIKHEYRLCTVSGKIGYFHCWEHYSKTVEASLFVGGAPAGIISFVRAIVEFPEGIGYADPKDIKFCDEENAMLNEMTKYQDEIKYTE